MEKKTLYNKIGFRNGLFLTHKRINATGKYLAQNHGDPVPDTRTRLRRGA